MKKHRWSLALAAVFLTPVLAQAQQDRPGKELVTKATQEAIEAGMAYLAKAQAADGSWGTGQYAGNVGITGLAGLAFLAGDHRPGKGPHADVVAKAVAFVLSM